MPKRKFGTRRVGGLILLGPASLATGVIGAYVEKARTDAPRWSTQYLNGINSYVQADDRRAEAAAKLQLWYESLEEHVPSIVTTFASIKSAYAKKLSEAIKTSAFRKEVARVRPAVRYPAP